MLHYEELLKHWGSGILSILTFPENQELVSVFGAEPFVSDEEADWANNRVIFNITQQNSAVFCDIYSRENKITFIHTKDEKQIIKFDMSNVEAIIVAKTTNRALLRIESKYETCIVLAWVNVYPYVSIDWSTNLCE